MPTVLRRQPIPVRDTIAFVSGEPVRLRAYQIIVWVGLSPTGVPSPLSRPPAFPAILDTGHSHNFSIRRQHLADWSGIGSAAMPMVGSVRERGRYLPLYAAHLFLNPNVPGLTDRAEEGQPFRITLPRGITVYPEGDYPRLPLIGLRTLLQGRLRLRIDADRRSVSLTAPPHWWPFG